MYFFVVNFVVVVLMGRREKRPWTPEQSEDLLSGILKVSFLIRSKA